MGGRSGFGAGWFGSRGRYGIQGLRSSAAPDAPLGTLRGDMPVCPVKRSAGAVSEFSIDRSTSTVPSRPLPVPSGSFHDPFTIRSGSVPNPFRIWSESGVTVTVDFAPYDVRMPDPVATSAGEDASGPGSAVTYGSAHASVSSPEGVSTPTGRASPEPKP